MAFSLWLWPTTKLTATKNTRQMLANSMAMQIRRCNAGRIAQWSASMASCEATRYCHWVSVNAILPRRPPWLTILNETKKTLTKHNFYLAFSRETNAKKLNNFVTGHRPSTHVLGTITPILPLTLLFKLKSSATFWAIKRNTRTKIQKVIMIEQSPRKSVGRIWPYSG